MKRFLVKTVIFGLVVYILALGMDIALCKGLIQMEDYRFQDYAAMLKGGMNHDVLIMGNSRGKSHFDPHIIDSLCHVNSFCIGIGGYPINMQVAKFHLYREHNEKPQLIIQNVDHMTLNVISDIRHQHQSEQFFPLVYDPLMRRELKKAGYGFLELNVPLYRFLGYQQVIKNGISEFLHLKHYISCPAYKGHRPEDGMWDGTELRRMNVHPAEISDEAKVIFEAYLAECRADSIEVVLVNSPMYIRAKEKFSGLDEVRAYYECVAGKFGYKYLDYVDNCPISRDTNNFCVSVHMNPEATRVFTKLLCEDINRLINDNER